MMSDKGSGSMTREEIIMKVRGSGCKMLDRLDLWTMSVDEIRKHLEKSCCKVYQKLLIEEAKKKEIIVSK